MQSQVEVLGPADQPFLTEDNLLAWALYLAGTSFADDSRWCFNCYTKDMLRSLGYQGMLPADAAKKAVSDNRNGQVTYLFRRPNSELLKVFEDQKRFIQEGEGLAVDVIRGLMNDFSLGARSYEETIMRLVATFIYMRSEFLQEWKRHSPLIRIDDGGIESDERMPDGGRIVTHRGFKIISADAGDEIKEKLELK